MSSTIGSDRQALQALAERMVAAELAGDAAFFEHVLAEDVVIMPPGIPAVEGLTPCLAFIRQVLAEIQREFERTITDHPAELTVHGNLALDRGAFEQTLVPKAGGQTIYENWQYLRVFLRDNNGAWKLARVIWNQLEAPAWQIEHSVEADVSSALAWRFWTNIANWDDPPAKFILVGPFADGSTGSTLIPGHAPLSWRIRDVNPGRSATIEMPLDAAALTFRWTFEPSGDRRTRITQRIALIGENAAAFVEQAQAGFASNLAAGMTRIAAAMSRADAEPEKS